MDINPHMFRGYDLRGIVNRDLNPEIVEHIGRAFGTMLLNSRINRALVSYDCRATSEEYAQRLSLGIAWCGIDVVNIGLNMVGTFYWAQYHLQVKGGAFVTASHNPAEYNGFKFANGFSETLVSKGMEELKNRVIKEDYTPGDKPGTITFADIREEYFNDILTRLPITKKFKVVVDPSHATAGAIVPEILRRCGCEVIESNCNIDPSFPLGTPDPTETAVAKRLSQKVLETGADIGFSYDADGDRIGIVDEKGNIIWNDVLLALLARDVLYTHPGATIMYNTLCSKVVNDTIKEYGGTPFMWRTGHSFLKKKNQEIKAAFIGELSGHFFFSEDFYNHDDGIYTTFRLLNFMQRSGRALSTEISKLPKYISSPEIKIGCADDKKIALVAELSTDLKKDFSQAEIIDDERAGDGVRLEMPEAMLIVRYSQNGPYLTIKFEAKSEEEYNKLKSYINRMLKKSPEINWEYGVNLEALQ